MDPDSFERLARYVARVSILPYPRTGQTGLVLGAVEWIHQVVEQIPAPRQHLVRYYGAYARSEAPAVEGDAGVVRAAAGIRSRVGGRRDADVRRSGQRRERLESEPRDSGARSGIGEDLSRAPQSRAAGIRRALALSPTVVRGSRERRSGSESRGGN